MRMSRSGWIVFSSIFVVAGVVMMGFGFNSLSKASDSESWPSAEGVVISSEVVTHHHNGGDRSYSPEILYDYVVNGESLSGNSIKFGVGWTAGEARRYVNKYRAGKTVKVYYNVEDPSEAVLEPGVDFSTWTFPLLGALIALFGILFFLCLFFQSSDSRAVTDMSQEEMLE